MSEDENKVVPFRVIEREPEAVEDEAILKAARDTDFAAIVAAGCDGCPGATQIVYVLMDNNGDCAVGYYSNGSMPHKAVMIMAADAIIEEKNKC